MKSATKSAIILSSFVLSVTAGTLSCSGGAPKPENQNATAEEYNNKKFDDENARKDAQFLIGAAEINLEEIKMGQLAQQNGSAASVKQMGKMMEQAHTQSYNELTILAQNKIVTIPTDPNENGRAFYDKMKTKKGTEFDKEYTEMMIQDHKRAIELFESASNESRDPDVKQYATKTIPLLQAHLKNATAVK